MHSFGLFHLNSVKVTEYDPLKNREWLFHHCMCVCVCAQDIIEENFVI